MIRDELIRLDRGGNREHLGRKRAKSGETSSHSPIASFDLLLGPELERQDGLGVEVGQPEPLRQDLAPARTVADGARDKSDV